MKSSFKVIIGILEKHHEEDNFMFFDYDFDRSEKKKKKNYMKINQYKHRVKKKQK